jgi:hypothetical protein
MGAASGDSEGDGSETPTQPRAEAVMWLVLYYTPWCRMSLATIPHMKVATRYLHWQFNKAAQSNTGDGIKLTVKFGAVKCSVDTATNAFCKAHNINDYPTFRAMGVENGVLMFETQYDFQHREDPMPDGLIHFAQKSARLYRMMRQLIVPLTLADMGGGNVSTSDEGKASEEGGGKEEAAAAAGEEERDETEEEEGEEDGKEGGQKDEDEDEEEELDMPTYFKKDLWVVMFDKAPHRGGGSGSDGDGGTGGGSVDPLASINSTLAPSRMATVASAWAAKLRGRARFGLALCGTAGNTTTNSTANSTDPCLAEGVGWLPEIRIYGTGRGLGQGYSLTGTPIDDEWMLEVALRSMEAVVMATTEAPIGEGNEDEFDELRDHASDTTEEGEDGDTPPNAGGSAGGGSCGPNGGGPTGDAEEFIWSGEGAGGRPDFDTRGRKNKNAGLIDVVSNKEARRKRNQKDTRRRGGSYTHTLPKSVQNALHGGSKQLGGG